MATVGVVKAIVTADVARLKNGMKEAERSLDKFGKSAKAVGKSMTMKVTAPLVGAGVAAAKMASDFEFSMTQIESLVGRSAEEVESLKTNVLGLAGETGRAPKELADAMFFITSAGLDAEAATAALEMSAKAAAVGMGETVIVADAVTNAMNSYGMSADQAAFATDVLAKTVEQGKASAEDLAPQIGRLTPMTAELGIGFEQVGGALAFLTRRSGDASQSTTGLMGALKSLLKPSTGARDLMEEVGFSLEDFRAVAEKDFLGAMRQMREALEANGHEMSAVIEDVTGMNAAMMMTGENMGEARDIMNSMNTALGKTDEAFVIVSKTAQFKMSQAMVGVKASMITLGEKVLPIVVPMIQKLADVIGKAAEWFGKLSPTMQKVIVITGTVVAALGPLLIIIGSIASAVTVLLPIITGVAGALGAAILPVTALVAVGVGLTAWFIKSRKEAAEARDRQEELTAAFAAEGDEATLLVDRVEAVVQAHKDLKGEVEELTPVIEEFKGAGVLLGMALENKVGFAFEQLGLEAEVLEGALQGGSDEFQKLEEQAKRTATVTDRDLIKALRNADTEINNVTSALADQFANGKITREELEKMLDALDETADAYDDHSEAVQKDAKETLLNSEKQKEFAEILGAGVVENLVAVAEKSGDYQHSLDVLATRMENSLAIQTAQAEALAEEEKLRLRAIDAADTAMITSAKLTLVTNSLTKELEDEAVAIKDLAFQYKDLNEEQALQMAMSADRAMLSGASGRQFGEDLTDAAHWIEVVRVQREATAAAEEAIVDAAAEAAEIAADEEKIRQRALKLANDLQKAQKEVNDLESEQTSIQEERQRTLEEIASISDEITKLMEDQANFSATNANFAAEIAQEFRKAELAIMNLEEKIADLQSEVDAVPPDASTQREFVAKLKDQRKAVNTVEQALIDMNVIKEEDAGFMDLTAAEAQTLVRLQEQLQQTQLDMENGEATVLDLMVAEEAWTKGMGSAMEASRELTKAEADLADMETKAIQIDKDRKKAMLELEIAQYDLAEAKKIGTEETYLASRAEEEQAKVQEVINGLMDKRTDLQEKQTELALKEIQVVDELKFANERLKSVMEELNNLGEDGNEIWRELMELVHATTGEFRDLINLLKNKAGGGGDGASPATSMAATVASTVSGVTTPASGQSFFDLLNTFNPTQIEDATRLFRDVEAHKAGTSGMSLRGQAMGMGANPNVIVNVEGSVISEADLTEAINLAMQKITNSGGTAPSYDGLGSFVDFGG